MHSATQLTLQQTDRSGRLRRLAARRPLTVFLLIGLAGAYALSFVWGLAYHGMIPGGGLADLLHIAPDEVTGLMLVLSLFPSALYVTWAADGRIGVRRLLRRAFRWRVNPGWWLTVLLAPPVLTVSLAVLLGDELRTVNVPLMVVSQLGLLAVNFVVINLWEETVWTGVMQTRLEQRHNWFVAAWLTAIPFGAAHVPLQFFLSEPVTLGSLAGSFVAYTILGLIVRPMLGVFRRGTGDSLLLVALLHTVFNRTNNDNGIAATLLTGEMRAITMLIAVVILTTITALIFRPRLTRRYGAALDQHVPSASR